MAYLIIPVVCFVLLAGTWWFLSIGLADDRTWQGKIDDLDRLLPVQMRDEPGSPILIVKLRGHVTSLLMTFADTAVRLEMPLITALQQSRRDSYLAILRDMKLEPRISSNESDTELLECEIDAPSDRVSATVKDVFMRLFDVNATRLVEFRIIRCSSGQSAKEEFLEGYRSGKPEEPSNSEAQRCEAETIREERTGCVKTLAGVLLLPLPFMIAYLEFGFVAATAVMVAIIVSRECYRQWKKPRRKVHITEIIKSAILLLAGTTIYFNDPFFLQLIPTVILSAAALVQLVAIVFGVPWFSLFDETKIEDYEDQRVYRLFSYALIVTCIGGAAMNEYLRAQITLDAWIWYFAFVRIELALGFMVTAIPFMIYSVRKEEAETDNDSESQ